jgi:hypothetical protein
MVQELGKKGDLELQDSELIVILYKIAPDWVRGLIAWESAPVITTQP